MTPKAQAEFNRLIENDGALDRATARGYKLGKAEAEAELARLRYQVAQLQGQLNTLRQMALNVCGFAGGVEESAAIAALARYLDYPGY